MADDVVLSDEQIADDGKGLRRLDGVHRIAAGILLHRLRLSGNRQQTGGQGQDNSGGAKQIHGVVLQLGGTRQMIVVPVTIAAAATY